MKAALGALVLLCPALLGQLAGQEAEELHLLRKPHSVLLQLDGPGKLLPAFRATNFGTMLASESSSELKDLLQRPFRRLLEELSEKAGGRLSLMLERLEAYRGRISLALDFTPHPQAWAGVGPQASGMLVFAPDGAEDLGGIADRVAATLTPSKLRSGEIQVADKSLDCRFFGEDGEDGFTLPFMYRQHLILLYSEDLGAYAKSLLAEGGEGTGSSAEFRASPVALRIDLPQLLGLADDDASWQLINLDARKMFEVIGLASLRDMQLLLKPAGPRIMLESSLLFGEGERGIFGSLFSEMQAAPTTLAYVPESSRTWRAANLHTDRLLRTISRGLALGFNSDPDGPGMLEDFKAETGVDLIADICTKLDPSCLIMADLPPIADADPSEDQPWNLCMLFKVKDRDAFAQSWTKIMQEADIGLEFDETEEQFGVELHTAGFFGPSDEFAYAMKDDLLLLALGDRARDRLLTALRHVTRKSGKKPNLGKEFERLLRNQPAGYSGASRVDLLRYMEAWPSFASLGLGTGFSADLDQIWDQQGPQLIELLRSNGLDSLYGFMGYEGNRFRHRLLW